MLKPVSYTHLIEDEEAFLKRLLELPDQEAEEGKVFIIHGCKDEYAEFIIDNKEILSTKYIVPYIDKELKDKLIEKDSFYQICEEYNLNYPKTHVFNKGDEVVDFGFNYPCLLYTSFLETLGLEQSGLDKLIQSSYSLLGLMSFLTAGEQEVRAWTIKVGTKAPQAAGKIHSDIEKMCIRDRLYLSMQ